MRPLTDFRWLGAAAWLALFAALACGAEVKQVPAVTVPPMPPTVPRTSPILPPEWAEGWKILGVALPITGEMRDAYVEFRTPAGRKVTLAIGVWAKEGPMLEKVEWSGAPVRAKATLRLKQERAALFAEVALVSRKDELPQISSQIEVEAIFIETSTAIFKDQLHSLSEFLPEPPPGTSPAFGSILDPAMAAKLLERLQHQRGVELLPMHKITTNSGQRARIEVTREIQYATEFEPKVKGHPLVPKTFETVYVGTAVDLTAQVWEGGKIDAMLCPEAVELLGYVKETGEAVTPQPDFSARLVKRIVPGPPRVPKSGSGALRPKFSIRRLDTSHGVADGESVLIPKLPETGEPGPFPTPEKAGRHLMVLVTVRRVVPFGSPR